MDRFSVHPETLVFLPLCAGCSSADGALCCISSNCLVARNHDRIKGMENGDPCYYCGLPASSVDHVVPRAFLSAISGVDLSVNRHRILTVPACRECNSLLGASYQGTLEERKAHLKSILKTRYRKLLSSPPWSEAELEEIGPHLREEIERNMRNRDLIEARIRW